MINESNYNIYFLPINFIFNLALVMFGTVIIIPDMSYMITIRCQIRQINIIIISEYIYSQSA